MHYGGLHQQVTVIVSQSLTGRRPPPEPQPLSVPAISLRPALWLARQQPEDAGRVDELVRLRVADLTARLAAGAGRGNDGPADA